MIRLLGAEVNRLRSRRLTLITLLLVLLALGAFQLVVRSEAKPPSASDVAAGRAQFDEVHKDWVANHQQREQECVASGNSKQDCQESEPTEAQFGLTPTPFSEIGTIVVLLSVYLVGLATFIVAGSSIGAEYASGAISNWLSFIPQRSKVFAAKLITIAGFGLVFSALGAALSLGAAALIVRFYGGSLDGAAKLVQQAGRGLSIAAIMAIAGFCVGLVARHTAAAIGVLLGYLFVWFVRNAILGQVPWAQKLTPWTPEGNISAIVENGHKYFVNVRVVGDTGISFDSVERTITMTHAVTYWGVILAVLIVGSLLVFRRRDVN
jgi:ABC-2 type transport system permease protein